MDSYSLQLITLAAAYVLAVSFAAVLVILTVFNYLSWRKLDPSTVGTRLTTLEGEVAATAEMLTREMKRQAARNRGTAKPRKRGEEPNADEAEDEAELRETMVAEFQRGRRA